VPDGHPLIMLATIIYAWLAVKSVNEMTAGNRLYVYPVRKLFFADALLGFLTSLKTNSYSRFCFSTLTRTVRQVSKLLIIQILKS
jgi:hypothetical protein